MLTESSDEPPPKWGDWHWQLTNSITNFSSLTNLFPSLKFSKDIEKTIKHFPMRITPYYASLIRKLDFTDPIFCMSVPQEKELFNPDYLVDDPLNEEHDTVVPNLVHRYPDRALLLVTSTCAMYCRHCTRKRIAGQREFVISDSNLQLAVNYLKEHSEIQDVIISGGDPLTLATKTLERILKEIRKVPTVSIIRIGTRVPITLPMRITKELTNMLKKFHPLWINTHFNHPNEITKESEEALRRLADAGIPLGNQSVLLRGINDTPQVMEDLCRKLVKNRVRPYYLFQCDLVKGIEHFRTPISCGVNIMEYLRGKLSGLAIPLFVVDTPNGGGKIPVLPNYVEEKTAKNVVFKTLKNSVVNYPEV